MSLTVEFIRAIRALRDPVAQQCRGNTVEGGVSVVTLEQPGLGTVIGSARRRLVRTVPAVVLAITAPPVGDTLIRTAT